MSATSRSMPTARRRALRGVVALMAVCAALASASATAGAVPAAEADKKPATIFADAKKATDNAKTVRLEGTVHSGGQDLALDIVSGRQRGGGTIRIDGATFHVVLDPPDLYLKAGASTWKQFTGSAAAAQLVADRWFKTTTSNADFASIGNLADVRQLTDSLDNGGTITKRRTTKYHGTSAIPLVNSSGNGVLYVAAKGKPYIVGIRRDQGSGEVRFLDYGSASVPKVPKHAVDLSKLAPTSTTQSPQSA